MLRKTQAGLLFLQLLLLLEADFLRHFEDFTILLTLHRRSRFGNEIERQRLLLAEMGNFFLRLALHRSFGVIHHFAISAFHHLLASSEVVFKVECNASVFQFALLELRVLLGLFL